MISPKAVRPTIEAFGTVTVLLLLTLRMDWRHCFVIKPAVGKLGYSNRQQISYN
jgi:hypothetical protein